MTTTDARTENEAGEAPPADVPPSMGRRRRPAPKANLFWRLVFPVLVLAAAVGVFLLWQTGTRAILHSPDGRLVDLVTDPAEPGYEAFLDPTPTLLMVHHEAGELVGVTVMARTALDAGGSMVVLSPDLLVPIEADGEETALLLNQAYSAGGVDQVQDLVEGLFGFGLLEVLEVETEELGGVMRLVEPIPFLLADDLLVEDGDGGVIVWRARGLLELSGEVAAQIYAFRNPGEVDANRIERQLDLWAAWFSEIARADDLMAATLPFEAGLAPYLRSLGASAADIATPPVDPLHFEPTARPVYVLGEMGEAWMTDRGSKMVPLPVSPRSAPRPSVRLLDGTGDVANRDRLLPELVEAGAVVSVIGNADEFGVLETTVVYHRPEMADAADEIAAGLGVTAVLDEDVDEPVDLTITIGLDMEAG